MVISWTLTQCIYVTYTSLDSFEVRLEPGIHTRSNKNSRCTRAYHCALPDQSREILDQFNSRAEKKYFVVVVEQKLCTFDKSNPKRHLEASHTSQEKPHFRPERRKNLKMAEQIPSSKS
jgi:hypothetical protein